MKKRGRQSKSPKVMLGGKRIHQPHGAIKNKHVAYKFLRLRQQQPIFVPIYVIQSFGDFVSMPRFDLGLGRVHYSVAGYTFMNFKLFMNKLG